MNKNSDPNSQPNDQSDLYDLHYPSRELDENAKISVFYAADKFPNKAYLNSSYKTEGQGFFTFEAIRQAERLILSDPNTPEVGHAGLPEYIEACKRLLFSHNSGLIESGKIAGVQTVSGTEALRIGMEFIKETLPGRLYLSDPTYGNHIPIPKACGLEVRDYNYIKASTGHVDWESVNKAINIAEKDSVFLLQPCCHNPTGVDPTMEEWRNMARLMKERGVIPFFDVSFLGMMTGDPEKDNLVLKVFVEEGLVVLIAYSFSKIMSLYGERIGAFFVVCQEKEMAEKVQEQLESIVANFHPYSTLHAARIVVNVLKNPEIKEKWKEELKGVYDRVADLRVRLVKKLNTINVDRGWNRILKQKGFFTLLPLTPSECQALTEKHHIYLLSNGRISIGALNKKNIDQLVEGIKKVLSGKDSVYPKL